MATIDELTAIVEALQAQVAALTAPPEIVPNWGTRKCQTCGAEAEVIDASPETRATVRNGEGYCTVHATAEGVFDREHLTR